MKPVVVTKAELRDELERLAVENGTTAEEVMARYEAGDFFRSLTEIRLELLASLIAS